MPQGVEQQKPHGELGHLDLSRIAQDLQIRKVQVEAVVQLLDEGNTIPFITRYRKERTGGLDEEILRVIQERVNLLRQMAERKQTILRTIPASIIAAMPMRPFPALLLMTVRFFGPLSIRA